MTDNNPYSTPQTDVDNKQVIKSSLPKVIGIISIILGALGIFGAAASLGSMIFLPSVLEAQMSLGFSQNYVIGSSVISLLASAWAVFIGIKLVKYKDTGRRQYNYYAGYTVLISIIGYVVTQGFLKEMFGQMTPEMSDAAVDLSSVSSLTMFIAPIVVIIVAVLLNQKNVKDCLD